MKDIPEEILSHIFSYLEYELPQDLRCADGTYWPLDRTPQSTLASLCLVNRQFYRLAQTSLYRTVMIRNELEEAESIIRTLVMKPHLGRLTHSVSIDVDGIGFDEFEGLSEGLQGLDVPEELRQKLEDCLEDEILDEVGIAAVLLAFMPNLRVIDYASWTNEYDPSLLAWILRGCPPSSMEEISGDGTSRAHENLGFPNLREVIYRGNHGDLRNDTYDCEEMLLVPQLKRLHLLGYRWTERHPGSMDDVREHNASVELLELKDCLVNSGGIEDMLIRFPSLRSLSIELVSMERQEWVDYEAPLVVHLSDWGWVLRQRGTKLTELNLHTLYHRYFHDHFLPEEGVPNSSMTTSGIIGSLRTLRSLRRLAITKKDLVGSGDWTQRLVDVLPDSLETLRLYFDFNQEDDDDEAKLDVEDHQEIYDLIKSGELPALREVQLERHRKDSTCIAETLGWQLEGWEMCDAKDEDADGRPMTVFSRLLPRE